MLVLRQARALKLPRASYAHVRVFARANSNLPSNFDPKRDLPTKGEWKHLKHHIPGESVQKNDLKSRVPKFPLGKEIVPTLLPRPGVPQVSDNFTFRQVMSVLKRKTKPELIYEAEPHRLYFLALVCMAVVFTAYGLVLLEYGVFEAGESYKENAQEATESIRNQDYIVNLGIYLIPGAMLLWFGWQAARYPTRLVRRIWYLPGPKEHVRFTLYPFFPGSPTPVYTVPLENLVRSKRAKVWTGRGFYGTADNSLFFFVLKELGGKLWVVDRKGFFWADGRVFDVLFGKETLEEAELGIPYDAQVGMLNRGIKKKKEELKSKHGIFWKYKLQAEEMKKDFQKVTGLGNEGKKAIEEKPKKYNGLSKRK